MLSESNRMFVAGGLLIGALALATLGLRFGNRESAAKETDGRVDSALSSAARPVTPDAPADDPRNAGIARVLQAVHDSLQRGDLASAHVLLDAVLTMRSDEPQALLLQKELAVREAQAREIRSATLNEQSAAQPLSRAHASAKTTHARSATSRHVTDTSDPDQPAIDATPLVDARSDSATDNAAASDRAANTAALQPHAQPEPVIASAVQTAATVAEPVEQSPAPAAPSTVQSHEPTTPPPAAAPSDGPKTRAQVRDELSRARTNGTMSRFGNPDPYGPGGSPRDNTQPSIRTW
ncbi:DUF4148 domain-containing protein [Paraburkholderia terrae]|uniref:DUF4148 domain-containing protein n=1 Tax=Paraburkholderia terrae TaxID=311230 RepID=UPI00296AB602|nr:DUF4148 domain-containing protein [Paraburkholderia terrae]MDW3656026.1 DUF4148 domain-containing protein [Paraburkholderia terrae]